MKRFISLLACLALTLSMVSFGAAAADTTDIPNALCSEQAWAVLKLTNRQRIAQGLLPLSTFSTLQSAADTRTDELVRRYAHTRPDGTNFDSAITQVGLNYTLAAENIAAGQTSPSNVLNAWMNSAGHKANILNDAVTHMAAGYTDQACTIITETGVGQIRHGWAQLFMTDNCKFTSITPSQTSVQIAAGESMESAGIYLTLKCSVHGESYLPLLDELCTGYDPSASGKQTVKVTYDKLTANITVNGSSGGGGGGGAGGGGGSRPSGGGGSSAPSTPELDTGSADSWAVDWLNRADTAKLLTERTRTNFKSDVTRLQFADLAVTLAEQLTGKAITPAPAGSFTDTTDAMILKAKAAGIAAGYESDGKYQFRPVNPISRQEICVMLAHVFEYVIANGGQIPGFDTSTEVKGSFLDTASVEPWAIKQVALLTNNGIMGGKATDTGNALDPRANTALQESITLIVKLFDKAK